MHRSELLRDQHFDLLSDELFGVVPEPGVDGRAGQDDPALVVRDYDGVGALGEDCTEELPNFSSPDGRPVAFALAHRSRSYQ